MRFLHAADLHLDAPVHALSDSESVRRASLRAFSDIIDYAKAHQIPYIVIAGDLFDSPHPRESTKAAVTEKWKEAGDITFFLLAGNHDPMSAEGGYLGMKLPPNVKLFGKEWTSFTVAEGSFHGRSFSETGCLMEGIPASGEGAQVAVLHGDTQSANLNEAVSAAAMQQAGMQYVALGHIHKRRAPLLSGGCLICNSGCTVGHGFDETGEKGFYDVSITGKVVQETFVPLDAPRFYEIVVEIFEKDSEAEILQKIEQVAVAYRPIDYLRIRFVGETALSLPTKYNGSAQILELLDDTTLPCDFSALQNEQTLRGLFVKNMMEKMERASDEDAAKLLAALRAGLSAMES